MRRRQEPAHQGELEHLDALRERAEHGDEEARQQLLDQAAALVAEHDDIYLGDIAVRVGITHHRLRRAVFAHPRMIAAMEEAERNAAAVQARQQPPA